MMGPDKLINTSSSPPIHYDCLSTDVGNSPCPSKESASETTPAMFYTRLRKRFTQIRSHSQHGQRYQYQKLSSGPNTTPKIESTTRSRLNSLLSLLSITTLILSTLITTVSSNPVFVDNPSLAQFQSGRNIRHLPCIVRKSGRSGVCMFAIDCIKQNGTHLGTCIDRFYFGSCCDIKDEGSLYAPEIGDNSIDQNTISHHFTPESTTMPTSALFKLTTLAPHQHNFTTLQHQPDLTQMTTGVTQSFTLPTTQHKHRPSTSTGTSTPDNTRLQTTAKPQQSTTHKQSHFVVRTTAKPTKGTVGSRPTYTSTTKKKPSTSTTTTSTTTTTTTTTPPPILTTTPAKVGQDELLFDLTTPPTKLFTFQTVETTVATPTEPTKIVDFVTTERIKQKTTKLPQTVLTSTVAANSRNTTTHRPTTYKPKPQTSRKPPTTKKPTTHNKRTTVKPTRKPPPLTTNEQVKPQNQTAGPSSSTTASASSSALPNTTTTTSPKPSSSPKPKPRPTATITKVPKPTASSSKPAEKLTTVLPEQTSVAEDTKKSPTSTTTKKPLSPPTTTITTTSSTPASTSEATDAPLIVSTTTLKPGLVTWTDVDAEPASPNKPSLSDWMPVTTSAPIVHNKTGEPTNDPNSFEELGVSVSTSVSAVVNNNTIFVSAPQKPIVFHTSSTTPPTKVQPKDPPTTSTNAAPSTTSTTTSTTRQPIISTTTATSATVSTSQPSTTSAPTTTSASPAASSTTDKPSDSTSTTTHAQSTVTDTTAEAFTTEGPNVNATTVAAPTNSLEGVDYRQVCGRRMFPEPRIVGGSNAAFGRWPWQISLRQWRTSTYLHKCGAALLNENWAITAAHCVDNVPPSDLLLRLGEYDLAEEEEPYGYQERRVQIVASHPQFDPRTFEYDLALLRFYEPVTFQPNIIPVCVPDSDENFIGQTAFVTGWGRLYEDGPLPSVLQEVAVPVINNTICESMYRSAGYIEHIPHIFICAGWKKGGYDSCEGDSGGPMVLQREADKRFQLGGVISWGIGCAEANQPGVYTRISEFRDWINQILQF